MPNSKKNMNIFTDRFSQSKEQRLTDVYHGILDSIVTTGTASANVNVKISLNQDDIVERSSGQLRIKRSLVNKFRLISSIPVELSHRASEARCCLCHRVIAFNQSKPSVWYYSIRYTVNHFHYFVCYDAASQDKPTVKCYRRD